MKLAVPMIPSTGRISPVFEVSAHLLLVKLCRSGECTVISEAPFSGDPAEKLAYLQKQEVKILLCGAICNETLAQVKALGIQVFPFVSGEWREVLHALLAKDPRFLDAFVMPGCCRHHRECCRHQGCRHPIREFENGKEKEK